MALSFRISLARVAGCIFVCSVFVLAVLSSNVRAKPLDVAQGDTAAESANASDDDTDRESEEGVNIEVVVDGLTHPFAVAVHPDLGTVFVSDSGAGRVIRVVDGEIEEVITGFPTGPFGDTGLDVGPLGLTFINGQQLVVGTGGAEDGVDQLRIYNVSQPGEPAVNYDGTAIETEADDSANAAGTPDEQGDEAGDVEPENEGAAAETQTVVAADVQPQPVEAYSLAAEEGVSAEGEFYGMIANDRSVFVTSSGDAAKGWLNRADVIDGKLANFSRNVATTESTGTPSPFAIARSPEGFIVICQAGGSGAETDSVISFYDESGEELGNSVFQTGLRDVMGLSYGPVRGRLFAVDFSREAPESAGLYKLVADSETGCRAVLIAKLERPTALAFDMESNLFVTVLGPADSDQPSGQLLKISGLDVEPDGDE